MTAWGGKLLRTWLVFFGWRVFWLTATFVTFALWRASMSCLLKLSSLVLLGGAPEFSTPPSFFNSFTLSAYLRVLRVCSQQERAGETLAIIVVLLLPVKESFKT